MITGEQVRDAVKALGVSEINHHACCLCGYMTKYVIRDDQLYFDRGCDCTMRGPQLEPVDWDSPADWINMQDEKARRMLMQRFGLEVEND